jgi:hypothetical protein
MPLTAGFASRLVNPLVGCPMEGLGQKGGARSIHDDLHLRALALEQDGREVLLVGMDLLFFERSVIDRYKGALSRVCGLRADQILLNTSHNHAGPRLTHWAYSDGPDADYLEQVETALLEAAVEARQRREPVTLRAGMTTTDLPVSRRQLDAQGQALWAPSFQNEVCTALPFTLFTNARGQVVSLLFSVSCHPSMIYEVDISGEYPAAACRHLNERFATNGALFLQGCAGDTKPRVIADGEKRWRPGTWEELDEVGEELAERIAAAAHDLPTVTPDLQVCLEEVALPLQPAPSDSAFAAIRDNPQERQARRTWAADMIHRRQRFGHLPTAVPVALHGIQLGQGLRLFATDTEPVGAVGNLMLRLYDHGVTFPLGYSNGCLIYLPVTRMLPEHGYEVDSYWEYHYPAPFAPGCESPLLDRLRAWQQSTRFPNQPLG